MGLLQKACETYDYHRNLVGRYETGKEPLAPSSHMSVRADIEITVDGNGQFVSAKALDKNEPKVLIPVTEQSAGRSGRNPQPHPLCDQLGYLAPYNEAKHSLYVEQLKSWVQSDYSPPKLEPILRYIEGETIVSDLLEAGIIKLKEGLPDNEKQMVCWSVVGLGLENSGPCYTDIALFDAFDRYYRQKKQGEASVLCMLTGEITTPAKQHLKGVVPNYGNAKLISSNDKSNFTYRGRFTDSDEVETVGYEASQKAHNALRWLVANQGVFMGDRCFICWEPQQLKVPNPTQGLLAQLLPGNQNIADQLKPSDYQEQLRKTLNGWKSTLPTGAQVVIAALDAATSGRLAVTYYNELQASDFLDRLYDWDAHCCWFGGVRGEYGVQSPSVWQIVQCAYGTQRKVIGKNKEEADGLKVDDRVMSQQVQRLTFCRIDCARMPSDLMRRIVQRCSEPQSYTSEVWEKILFSACAVTRKYRYDQYKEEWSMALEPEKKDRSYQYGRMLAVLEKAERDTYEQEEKREPNAIRMMSVFTKRPQYAASILGERVKTAYYPKLKPAMRVYYDKLLQEIFAMISECGETGRPLGETYLMGYYLQRKELYAKKEDGGNKK